MRQFTATYKLFLQHQITKGRLTLISVMAAIAVLLGFIIGSSGGDTREGAVVLIMGYGINFGVPIIALVLASSSFGQLKEDETLVYLWLKPSSRIATVVAAWFAALSAVIPAVAIPLTITSLVASSFDFSLAGPTFLAISLAVVAYSAVFSFVGLVLKKALIWGFVYIFIWELLIGNLAPGTSKLAIKTYPTSILINMTDEDINGDLTGFFVSTPAAIITLVAITCASIALTAWRLQETEVA